MAGTMASLGRPGTHRGGTADGRRVPDSDQLASGVASPRAHHGAGELGARGHGLRGARGPEEAAGPVSQRAHAPRVDHRRAGAGGQLPRRRPPLSSTGRAAEFIPGPARAAPGPAPGAPGGAAARDHEPDPVAVGGRPGPGLGHRRDRGADPGRADRGRGPAGPARGEPAGPGPAAGQHRRVRGHPRGGPVGRDQLMAAAGVSALQVLLAPENAAVYGYGLAGAQLSGSLLATATQDWNLHRTSQVTVSARVT